MKKIHTAIFIIVAFSCLMNIIALPFVPDKIATHWDIKGEPDGYMRKVPGLLFLSVILTLIAAIEIVISQLRGVKNKLKDYSAYYYFFCVWVVMFLLGINIHIVLWNTQIFKLHPQHVFYPALAVLLAGMVCVSFKERTK